MGGGALRHRSFRLLLAGQSISSIGDGVAPVALAFAVLGHIGGVSDLGLILAAQTMPAVALTLVGGVWSDRLSRQTVMLYSDLLRAGVQGASAALILTGSARVWQLAVLQAIYGGARAFFRPAATGLVPQTVEPDQLQQANAWMGLGENLATVLGPALGGIFVVSAGAGWGLGFDGVAFVVSAISLRLMSLAPIALPPRRGTITELREGWHAFRSRTWLWASVLSFTLLITVVFAPLDVLGPEVARAQLGGAGAWAAIGTTSGIGAVLGGLVGLRWRPRFPLRTAFLLTLAGEPVMLILLGHGGPLAPLIAFALISGLGATLFNVFWFTVFQREIPANEISRVSSWDYLGSSALQPIGLAVVGPIAGVIGISATLYSAAALAALFTVLVLAVPAVRDYASAPSPDDAPGALSSDGGSVAASDSRE
jgi:predicted MFS family arabinose efflux permease